MEFKSSNLIPNMETIDKILIDPSVEYYIPENHKLTQRDIVRILERGIETVNVKISDEYDTFNSSFDELIDETIKSNNIDRIKEMSLLYKDMCEKNKTLRYDISKYLENEKNSHIVNTVNISVILANAFNKVCTSKENINIEDIALAALLEDIGRTCADDYIFRRTKNKYSSEINKLCLKYNNLTEEMFEKYNSDCHPIYSYLICKNYDLNENILKAILYHHEKEFGSGALLGIELSKEQPDNGIRMAQIIKLADLFDALITSNVKENPKDPFNSISSQIDKIVALGLTNAKMTNILKKVLPLYQVGMKVELSDGTLGLVSSNETIDYASPIITDFNGVFVDLQLERIKIVKHHKEK